jgi:hypothetical protein
MLIVVALVALVAAFLFFRHRQSKPSQLSESSDAIDAWLVAELASKLAGVAGDKSRVEKALRGDPDPDIVSSIEEHVQSVEVEFVKDAHTGDVDVVLRVTFEKGEQASARSRMKMSEVPASVRDDFERKAVAREFRKFAFPWSRSAGAGALGR